LANPDPSSFAASAAPVLPSASRLAVLSLLVNAFVWGVSWLPFRHLDALGLHGLWSTAIVYACISLLIAVMRPAALVAVARHPALWWLVLASGLTNACFNWAVTIGDVIRVVLLFYLMPVWAVLLARWLLAEPITPAVMLRVGLGVAGAAVVLLPADALTWPVPRTLADWLAIAGGASFAATNVLLRRHAAVPAEGRALAMFAGGVVVAGGLGVVLVLAGTIAPMPSPGAGWLSAAQMPPGALLPGVGIVGTLALLAAMLLLGNLSLQYGAARLAASVTAVVMLTEILFASVSAILLGGESLAAGTLLGGAMIVASAALAAREP
jgi:drug/metabolite transporter (DMT)-like permease